MQRLKTRLRASMNRAPEVIALALFCLTVVAGISADDKISEIKPPASSSAQDLKGTLTVSGEVTVNHKPVQTGATISSGDLIITGPQADVTIDLGRLGSIRLRPNTSLHLMLEADRCQIVVDRCGCITQTVPEGISAEMKTTLAKVVNVAVTEGEVWVNKESGKDEKKSLKAGKDKMYRGVSEIKTEGGTSYTVQCCQCCFVEKVRPSR